MGTGGVGAMEDRTGDSLLFKGIGRLEKSLLFNDFWISVQSPPATEVWFTRTGDSLLCNGIGRLDKLFLFRGFWLSVQSPPATEVWFTRTGDSLLCKGIGRLDKPSLFNGFWRSVQSPPATEVWFRCAPPHVASLINSVQDRRDMRLMSGGDRGPAWHWSGDSLLDEGF